MFAPETPTPLYLWSLCSLAVWGHRAHSSHPALYTAVGAEPHISIPAPALILGTISKHQPLNRVPQQILPCQPCGFKQPQPQIHDSAQHKITDTRGASPSARCVRVKSGHETVTIVPNPSGHTCDPAGFCASRSRNKGTGQRFPSPGDELHLREAQPCIPTWLRAPRTWSLRENQLFPGSLCAVSSIPTPTHPAGTCSPGSVIPGSPGNHDGKMKSLGDQLTGPVPGEEPGAALRHPPRNGKRAWGIPAPAG